MSSSFLNGFVRKAKTPFSTALSAVLRLANAVIEDDRRLEGRSPCFLENLQSADPGHPHVHDRGVEVLFPHDLQRRRSVLRDDWIEPFSFQERRERPPAVFLVIRDQNAIRNRFAGHHWRRACRVDVAHGHVVFRRHDAVTATSGGEVVQSDEADIGRQDGCRASAASPGRSTRSLRPRASGRSVGRYKRRARPEASCSASRSSDRGPFYGDTSSRPNAFASKFVLFHQEFRCLSSSERGSLCHQVHENLVIDTILQGEVTNDCILTTANRQAVLVESYPAVVQVERRRSATGWSATSPSTAACRRSHCSVPVRST